MIGFPSKSFKQEFDTDAEVAKFCKMKYGVTFPLSRIADVNTHPVFQYLTKNSPVDAGKGVAWNFEKFVVNKDGKIVGRFGSRVNPLDPKIVALMSK